MIFDDRGHEVFDVCPFGDVYNDRRSPAKAALDFLGDGVSELLVEVRDHNHRALLGVAMRRGLSQSPAAPADNGNPVQ